MSDTWTAVAISALGRVVTGKTPPTKIATHFGGSVPFVTPSDMDGRKTISTTDRYLTHDGVEAVKGATIPSGAVMVSCIGSDMGKVAVAGRDCVTNQQINSIVVEEQNDPSYVYYNLSGRKAELQNLAGGGSAQPILNKGHFSQIEIDLPPLPEQKAIARILGALDDKIELNRKMNRTLEAMARAIFKSWFVDFDPVRAKAEGRRPDGMDDATAALFPDAFEDSELGEIPAGWRVVPLPDVIEVNPFRSLKKGKTAVYLEMKNMPTQGPRALSWGKRPFGSGAKFTNGDTLLARITPCLENGKTAYVDFLADGEVGGGSTEYIVLRPLQPLPVEYAYFLARDDEFRSFAIQNMTGTSGRQRTPPTCFDQYVLVIPDEAVAGAFGRIAGHVLRLIKAKDEESRTLAALRDTLLPKLMSGEVRCK